MKLAGLIALLLLSAIYCKSKEEWKSRSIYQLLTDRFARSSDTGYCNYSQYCGGNYRGLISKLDYIKGMGFDASLKILKDHITDTISLIYTT